MNYPLDAMGPIGFQQLAAALAVKVVGSGIQVFGLGPDGGRDFIYRGAFSWAADGKGETWDGYTVFQAKHKSRLDPKPAVNAAWLKNQIISELDEWASSSTRKPMPDNLVFVTNVPLSAVPGSGGFDSISLAVDTHLKTRSQPAEVDKKFDFGADIFPPPKPRLAHIKKWRVWDGNQIETFIAADQDVRFAFNGLLTAHDVLSRLGEWTHGLPLDRLLPALEASTRQSILEDQYLYFDEAGADATEKTLLHDVVIDLPTTIRETLVRTSALRELVAHGDRSLRGGHPFQSRRVHFVLTGSPGNGKSTVTRFLAQLYRAAMLQEAELAGGQTRVRDGTRDAANRLGFDLPKNRRWPIRIDLAEYSEVYTSSEGSTLLKWIAAKVSRKLNAGWVTAGTLESWLGQWPWLVILDGLDEVTAVKPRRELLKLIESFVAEADHLNADLLVVLTTRPTGYVEEVAPEYFARLDLTTLSPREASEYGRKLTQVRLSDEPERRSRTLTRLDKALANEKLRHLMQTPLQVLIVSLILESSGIIEPDRYGLFWAYYNTVVKREQNKPGDFADLLQSYEAHILRIHERVGFALQVSSERADGAMSISIANFRALVTDEMTTQGFDLGSHTYRHLVDSLVQGATHRLVLLAPRPDEGVGFELRSLQELMAARHLTHGRDDEVMARLVTAAASPHWRNTWVFAAGRLFAGQQEHQQEAIVKLVAGIDRDASWRLGAVCPVAPTLALDLVADGLASQRPNSERELLRLGLAILQAPLPADPLAVARVLVRVAEREQYLRLLVGNGLREALAGSIESRETSRAIQYQIPTAVKELGAPVDVNGLFTVSASTPQTVTGVLFPPPPRVEEFLELTKDSRVRATVQPIFDALLQFDFGAAEGQLVQALENQDAARILELSLESMAIANSQLRMWIRDHVVPAVVRKPIGAKLQVD